MELCSTCEWGFLFSTHVCRKRKACLLIISRLQFWSQLCHSQQSKTAIVVMLFVWKWCHTLFPFSPVWANVCKRGHIVLSIKWLKLVCEVVIIIITVFIFQIKHLTVRTVTYGENVTIKCEEKLSFGKKPLYVVGELILYGTVRIFSEFVLSFVSITIYSYLDQMKSPISWRGTVFALRCNISRTCLFMYKCILCC